MKYPTLADITEMKARGYDAITIAEAEQKSARWQEAQEVHRLIEDAFSGVALGNGVGLQEAQGLDDYKDAETCAAYRAKDEKDDWHRISSAELNRCNSSLSFFDAEGMRFHLPAFLIADLRGEYGCGMAFCLTHLTDHSRSHYFPLLSSKQRAAVRAFLLLIAEESDYALDRPHIIQALDDYWV